jgi:hypothetical protein
MKSGNENIPSSDRAAKDKMAAAARSWTLSVEQQELLIKSCFEGDPSLASVYVWVGIELESSQGILLFSVLKVPRRRRSAHCRWPDNQGNKH